MKILMRRPEITSFISIAPPANYYDFSFLAPCPSSGLVIQGKNDTTVTPESVTKLVGKINAQKTVDVTEHQIDGADHFFGSHIDEIERSVGAYVDEHSNAVFKETDQQIEG